MKLLLLATFGLFLQPFVYSQTQPNSSRIATPIPEKSNIERYNIDYTLKDYTFSNSDSTILNQIDLTHLENFRSEDHNVEVEDPSTGLIVILFYQKKVNSNSTFYTRKL